MMRWLACSLLVVAFALPVSARAEVRSFALVIGTNLSNDAGVAPLRYADDDAVNNARLLAQLGAEVVLLVKMDADTRRLAREVPETPPTRAALDAAMVRLNGLMSQARAAGHRPVLYFFYSGHGDVENNRGYVNLSEGRLWRDDLLALLEHSTASENHVIVDACKSYFLVFERGSGGKRTQLAGSLLGKTSRLPANTGVVLSTSSAADSHEWEAFQGGVFSHEIRSALRGAADQDLDGKVTYEEAAAFVWSANAGVPNARYRPDVFVRAPAAQTAAEAVLAAPRTRGDTLLVGPGVSEHLYLEDQAGRRIADVRPAPEQKVALLLPRERPLFVHQVDSDQEVELPPGAELVLASLPRRAVTSARRGAEHVAFRSLFARGFGAAALVDYRNCPPQVIDDIEARRDLTWLRRGLGAFGAVSAGVGATMTVLALRTHDDADGSGRARRDSNERIDRYNAVAITGYAVGGAAIASFLVWTLWPERKVDIQVLPGPSPSASVATKF